MKEAEIYCLDCGFQFSEINEDIINLPCPICNSLKREFHESVDFGLVATMSLRGQAKNNNFPKKKRVRWDSFTGYEKSNQLGKLVKKIRVIDKDQNIYKETIIDPDTNEIIHNCEEPLDKHVGHGSAKTK